MTRRRTTGSPARATHAARRGAAALLAAAAVLAGPPDARARQNSFQDPVPVTASAPAPASNPTLRDAKGVYLVPGDIKLDDLAVGRSAPVPVMLRNADVRRVKIGGVAIMSSAGGSVAAIEHDACSNTTIDLDGGCYFVIKVTPRERGRLRAVVMVKHDGLLGASVMEITGEALDPMVRLTAQPLRINDLTGPDKISVGAGAAAMVSNVGDHPVTIANIFATVRPLEALGIDGRDCLNVQLQPGARCAIVLTRPPNAPSFASDTADLVVHHDGPSRVTIVGLDLAAGKEAPKSQIAQPPPLAALLPPPPKPEPPPPLAAHARPPEEEAPGGLSGLRLVGLSGNTAILEDGGRYLTVREGGTVEVAGRSWDVKVETRSVRLSSGQSTRRIGLAMRKN